MFKDVAFGQYYPVDSPVHRLDARVKLLLTLMFVIAIFFVKSYFGFMLTLIMLIAIILLARLPMASVLKSVKGVLLIVLITAIINYSSFAVATTTLCWCIGKYSPSPNREFIQP